MSKDQRKPLLDAVRAMLERGLTPDEVERLDSRTDVLLASTGTAAPEAAEPVPHFDMMKRHLERDEAASPTPIRIISAPGRQTFGC